MREGILIAVTGSTIGSTHSPGNTVVTDHTDPEKKGNLTPGTQVDRPIQARSILLGTSCSIAPRCSEDSRRLNINPLQEVEAVD
ncbi:hypothetical protein UPYG_G00086910 [Umbra pygmaea]|uniref:Uncharacterized protein n=1 Tax=Umbra pygmaea TaxID=75934 RepID=A0ABD0XU69_UMBPY